MAAPLLIRTIALLCGVLILGVPHASAACDGAPLASGNQTIEVDGARRTFLVRGSPAYDGRTAAPVVITFHPFGMNAQYMQSRVSVSRTWPEAVAVHGEASGGGGTPPSWQTPAETARNGDLRYFDAVLAWLAEHACIDQARVFVLGYSNGAQFANLLACQRRTVIAAVASAAGRLPCAPPEATPAILSHGLGDRTIPYMEAVAASRVWAETNRCTAPPPAGTPGCFTPDGCEAAPVALCTYAGGHEYDVSFTAEAMAFFRRVAGAP
jgi:poly(3-hydroxybutyrate) depolymerase